MSTFIELDWRARTAAASLALLGSSFAAGGNLGLAEYYARAETNPGASGYHASGASRRPVCPVASDTPAGGVVARAGVPA